MKKILGCLALSLVLLSGCKRITEKESISMYKEYYKSHKQALNSIVNAVVANYNDSTFGNIPIDSIRDQLARRVWSPDAQKIVYDILQIEYYKYTDTLRAVRIFLNKKNADCISISLFKAINSGKAECERKKDPLYLEDCWSIFLIRQSPCAG